MNATKTERLECFWAAHRRDKAAECRDAIGAFYFEDPAGLDVRYLWSRDGASFFRVNFWRTDLRSGEPNIRHSAFIRVEKTNSGARVVEPAA